MTRDEEIQGLFDKAIDVAPDERSDFLDQECGADLDLRDEVESLLSHHDRDVERPLTQKVADQLLDAMGLSASSMGKIPDRLGPYEIIEKIGEGAMGTVYLAEQKSPVLRQVALKIIKLGMDTKEVIARFESERQALAMMNHPNIAKIHDAGTSDAGRPYFVMEYVPGIPISKHCDQQRLSTRERLELFIQVCHGVQHSHQKGVIHRDLKPSNVIVVIQDGNSVVKIIDFGVAKAIYFPLTEKTLVTSLGQPIGTPEYMSPEQTNNVRDDIDTRTDIYSLGVLLYELLVGEPPFALRKTALEEVFRRIREADPAKPSTRITSLGEAAIDTASRRSTDIRTLARQLRGDLDWISLKAMEKDRSKRYAAATDLSDDIQRYLDCEPIVARPPSASYRLKKLLQKYAGLAAALALVFLVTLIGGGATTAFYFQAKNGQKEAEREREAVLRLSDIRVLQQLVADSDELWPTYPEKIDEMEAWLKRAEKLVENLPTHQASLAELTKRLETNEKEPESTVSVSEGEDVLIGSSPSTRGNLRDTQIETQWQLDILRDLVLGLETLLNPDPNVGVLAHVKKRIQFAKTLHVNTIESHRRDWTKAIKSIRNEKECPAYQGLELKPQLGLIPIGRDQESLLWEFSHAQSGETPARDANGRLLLTEETGLVMILIPGGKFWMGAQREKEHQPNYDPDAEGDTYPLYEVHLDPFFMSKYEMTQAQWKRFTGDNPSGVDPTNYILRSIGDSGGLLHPVEQVSWQDCYRVLGQLKLRLPTEAQWEYSARAGTGSIWWTGDERETLRGFTNILDISARKHHPSFATSEQWDDGYPMHASVGSFPPNPFGLYDVHGNVSEWCWDLLCSYGQQPRPGDGARIQSRFTLRIYRGGRHNGDALRGRSALRMHSPPDSIANGLGVRPARPIDP